jgi:hypothetical protein
MQYVKVGGQRLAVSSVTSSCSTDAQLGTDVAINAWCTYMYYLLLYMYFGGGGSRLPLHIHLALMYALAFVHVHCTITRKA